MIHYTGCTTQEIDFNGLILSSRIHYLVEEQTHSTVFKTHLN